MMQDDMLKFRNKSIKIFLKNRFVYSGTILELREESLTIIDKFGKEVLISLNDISSVTEVI